MYIFILYISHTFLLGHSIIQSMFGVFLHYVYLVDARLLKIESKLHLYMITFVLCISNVYKLGQMS